MTTPSPEPLPASAPSSEQPSLAGTGLSSGLVAPMLAFTMGKKIAALSLVPFTISVVMVIAGLSLGISHGVDWVAWIVDPALSYLLDEGWFRSLLTGLVAWPVGLLSSLVLGYQIGFLISLPLLDRLALAVERHEGWHAPGKGLGLATSALSVSIIMVVWLCGSLVFMLLGLIPVVGVAFVVLGWLWSSVCVALDALDPSFARAGLGLSQRIRLLRRHAVPVLTFGALASLWMMIPGSYPGIVVGGSRLASRIFKSEATGQGL